MSFQKLVSHFNLSTNKSSNFFRPLPEHKPQSTRQRYQRVHSYVSLLGSKSSSLLKKTLLAIHEAAERIEDPQIKALALKQYTESEFLPATKELLCIWLHLEAVDQGGEEMPAWLLQFLKLSLYATDYLIDVPSALEIMDHHALCADLQSLHLSVSLSLSIKLGFGQYARSFAPAFIPLLTTTRKARQRILQKVLSMTIEIEADT